jgi:hypothetical protein
MPSMTPSEYAMQLRTDGGPFVKFELLDANENIITGRSEKDLEHAESSKVYYRDVTNYNGRDLTWLLIIQAHRDIVITYPLQARIGKQNYGQPKYNNIVKIVFDDNISGNLPFEEDGLEELLKKLPKGFIKDWRFGLGILYDYRYIPYAIEDIDEITTIMVISGDEPCAPVADGDVFFLSEKRFETLRAKIDQLNGKYSRERRNDMQLLCYSSLLHESMPSKYPAKARKLPPDLLAELVALGSTSPSLTQRDRKTVVDLVEKNLPPLAKDERRALYKLKADIELVTLSELITVFEKLLDANSNEERWQQFLAENIFILDLAFGYPVKIIGEKPYVGGKGFNGQGGQFSDFVMASDSTSSLAIIEIKAPSKELLSSTEYRASVYAPSRELSGSVSQALSQRMSLQQNFFSLANKLTERVNAVSVPIVIIIGRNPDEDSKKISFECYRNSLRDVLIITFDELLLRLKTIYRALQP